MYIPPNEIIIDDITYKIVNRLNLYTCWNFTLQTATLDSAFKYFIIIFSFKILFRCLHTAVIITSLQM